MSAIREFNRKLENAEAHVQDCKGQIDASLLRKADKEHVLPILENLANEISTFRQNLFDAIRQIQQTKE